MGAPMSSNRVILLLLAMPASALALPEGIVIRPFAGPPNIEYPTGISAAPNGDVYVSLDKNGSLGQEEDFGKIISPATRMAMARRTSSCISCRTWTARAAVISWATRFT